MPEAVQGMHVNAVALRNPLNNIATNLTGVSAVLVLVLIVLLLIIVVLSGLGGWLI